MQATISIIRDRYHFIDDQTRDIVLAEVSIALGEQSIFTVDPNTTPTADEIVILRICKSERPQPKRMKPAILQEII